MGKAVEHANCAAAGTQHHLLHANTPHTQAPKSTWSRTPTQHHKHGDDCNLEIGRDQKSEPGNLPEYPPSSSKLERAGGPSILHLLPPPYSLYPTPSDNPHPPTDTRRLHAIFPVVRPLLPPTPDSSSPILPVNHPTCSHLRIPESPDFRRSAALLTPILEVSSPRLQK